MPKNIAANVLNVDRTHKLRKNSNTKSMDLRPEMSQNQMINPNVEESSSSMKDVLKYLSNEVAAILQDKKYLNSQTDINTG